MQGLLDAARRYDPQRGVPFRVYAGFRVTGAIYDGVERYPTGPWRTRRRLLALEAIALDNSHEIGARQPPAGAASELARRHAGQVVAAHFAGMTTVAQLGLMVAADAEGYPSDSDPDPGPDPERRCADVEMLRHIRHALESLHDPEREVLRRCYFEGQCFEAIANGMNRSKSWVS